MKARQERHNREGTEVPIVRISGGAALVWSRIPVELSQGRQLIPSGTIMPFSSKSDILLGRIAVAERHGLVEKVRGR